MKNNQINNMNQSAKKIIVEFLTKKREIINKLTDTNFYLYDDDINDIINLSEDECIEILKRLFNSYNSAFLHNSSICPHCIIIKISYDNTNNCKKCTYAERHKICDVCNINNDFGIIINIIRQKYNITNLYRIDEIKKLCNETIEIKNNFFKNKNR